MGFLSRALGGHPQIVPTDNKLDIHWFRGWMDRVVDGSGVDRGDEENHLTLITKLEMVIIHNSGTQMELQGHDWAIKQFRQYREESESRPPWELTAFLAGYDIRMIEYLESQLNKFETIVVEAGRRDGEFRM